MLSQYLNHSKTFQPLKYIASEWEYANGDLVCYQLTTIFIISLQWMCDPEKLCILCKCDRERRALVVHYNDIWEKFLNDTSQNAVTASLENVLSWKIKTNMFRLAKFVFSAIRRRKEFMGQTSFTIQHCTRQTGFTVSFTC